MQLSDNEKRILVLLEDRPKLTSHAIAELLSIKYSTAAGTLRRLYRLQCVQRQPDPKGGPGFIYIFNSAQPNLTNIREPISPPVGKETESNNYLQLDRESIEDLLSRWAQSKWQPKIFKSARNLPLGVARLYELAIDMAYGSHVTQDDIKQVMDDFEKFRKDLIQTLKVVNGFIKEKRLKTPDDLYAFLMSKGNIEELKELSLEVKQLN